MRKLIALLFLSTLYSCSSNESNAQHTSKDSVVITHFPIHPLVVLDSSESGWGADIRLSYSGIISSDSSITYLVNSNCMSKNIGFELIMPKSNPSRLTFKSIGQNSDNFIKCLARLYGQKVNTSIKFVNEISADYINLNKYLDSLNAEKDIRNVSIAADYKLFFQGEKAADHAELFLNINTDEHWVELCEKDFDYREPLLRLLKLR